MFTTKLFRGVVTILLLVAALVPFPGTRAEALSASLTRVESGLDQPVAIAAPNDGSNRLFIVEREGRIKLYKDGAVKSTYLSITDRVACCSGEMGMFGLAFHPNFAENGRFYVTYSDGQGDLRLSKFIDSSPSGLYANKGTERVLLQINHRANSNHWGGQLQFHDNWLLYMSTGDGGGQQDPGNNAQDRDSLLGKVLRIDVGRTCGSTPYCTVSGNPYYGSTPGRGEIYHRGLRNPWKFSFDSVTDNIWIGDVGQYRYEEIDRANASRNFGWPCREGFHDNPDRSCGGSFTNPIAEYSHTSGRCAIIGGHVIRGTSAPSTLSGKYVFADYCSGDIWAYVGSGERDLLVTHSANITSMGRSISGHTYILDAAGRMYRLTAS